MKSPAAELVIMGNNITALALVRGARRHNIRPVLFDCEAGIAFKSCLADKVLCPTGADTVIMDRLTLLGSGGKAFLIAVSDDWIRFVIRNREELERHFKCILHAQNEVLLTCLNKDTFSLFCLQHELSAPRYYDLSDSTRLADIEYPVIMRPSGSSIVLEESIPKAVHIDDEPGLNSWRETFRLAGVPYVVTESLLHHQLRKYSVAIARSGKTMVSYVAEQFRPQPKECGVGAYVELSPNQEVEALARRVAELLDYYGMGEMEILYSQDAGRYYLIEFNVRPWLQYSLAESSNHCLLKFLIDADAYQRDTELKTGKSWLSLENDLHLCFSRSIGYLWHGRIGWREYLHSLLRLHSPALFSWKDPWPALYSMGCFLFRVLRRPFRKSGLRQGPRLATAQGGAACSKRKEQ